MSMCPDIVQQAHREYSNPIVATVCVCKQDFKTKACKSNLRLEPSASSTITIHIVQRWFSRGFTGVKKEKGINAP